MKNGIHTKFILSPIFEILEDCVSATKGIGDGIGSYPLCEYVMQTTFLKMTGASEQKLKCIIKDLASNDKDFLEEKFFNNHYSECSAFKSKNEVFKDLINEISKNSTDPDVLEIIFDDNIKADIVNRSMNYVQTLFEKTVIARWQEKEFRFFKENLASFIDTSNFCMYSKQKHTLTFFNQQQFDMLFYSHRNRCAHNLKSIQINIPNLSVIVGKDYDYQNYFFRFSILVLLDEIFMKMYSTYLELLEKNV